MTTNITVPADAKPLCFDDLKLQKPILKALAKSGYTIPTPIQAGAIPCALNQEDLLLSAQTGSGKTAAFVLPILNQLCQLDKQKKHIHALILTPTRELAQQVYDSVRRYGANIKGLYSTTLVGGSNYGGQIRNLRKGVQIVIATPGRLLDHMTAGRVDLSALSVLVLDEADRMLDMGFAEDIEKIMQAVPTSRQTIMSSATWDGEVGKIAENFTNNPKKIAIKVETAHIDESVYFCDDFHHKNKILLQLLGNPEIKQAVVFTATKKSTEDLTQTLTEAGLSAKYLHGDLPQGKRNRIISDIKANKYQILVATDVAARGIDISAISHVVNYDLPRQVEDYVHRIGRCGRAGRTGVAMNLCSIDDRRQLTSIGRYLKREIKEEVLEGLEPKRNIQKTHHKSERDKKRVRSKTVSDKFNRMDKKQSNFIKNQDGDFEQGYFAKPHKKRDRTGSRFELQNFEAKKAAKSAFSDKKSNRFFGAVEVDDNGFTSKKRSKFAKSTTKESAPTKNTRRPSTFKKDKPQKRVEEVLFNQTAPKKRKFGHL